MGWFGGWFLLLGLVFRYWVCVGLCMYVCMFLFSWYREMEDAFETGRICWYMGRGFGYGKRNVRENWRIYLCSNIPANQTLFACMVGFLFGGWSGGLVGDARVSQITGQICLYGISLRPKVVWINQQNYAREITGTINTGPTGKPAPPELKTIVPKNHSSFD